MCGITGYINLKQKVDNKVFERMNNIIRYRGPDDEGYVLSNKRETVYASGNDTVEILKKEFESIKNLENNYNIVLGHRRLSIIDLSEKGHQPMRDEGAQVEIVFNGEIYNYIEIREELEQKGYKFDTNCDTEVIINAYKEWGTQCVNRFNGMWAFAIYDKRKSYIFCSRDRFGVKPFYYYYDDEKVIFASEIKQILEERSIKRVANDKVIFNYLFYGKDDYNEETFFQNIYALLPSYNMIISVDYESEKLSIEKYQYYCLEEKQIEYEEKLNVQEYKREFERSIRYRLRSDIPVGSCLSGGLDSSSVVSIACKELKKKNKNEAFETFTSCYDENANIDERYYSKKVIEKTGCRENLVFPNKENIEEELERVIWHHDAPFPTLSIYAQWCVMKAANKKNVKVLLDGQGGDETLLGYERYTIFLIKENLRNLQIKQLFMNYKILKKNYHLSLLEIIQFLIYFSNKSYFQYLTKKIKMLKLGCINKKFFRKYKRNKDYLKNIDFSSWFKLQKTEICYSNLVPLLRYEDRNSMAFSIETRVPFLDYQLVEKAMQIPLKNKIKEGYTKNILRKGMQDEMDAEVVYRKSKLGFAAPQKDWMNKISESYIEKYLKIMKTKKYFNEKEIRKIFRNKSNEEMRWKFLSLEMWTDIYNVEVE